MRFTLNQLCAMAGKDPVKTALRPNIVRALQEIAQELYASTPNLLTYDIIVVNTSGGKDSQSQMHYVHGEAVKLGIAHRLVAYHADLGRVEWSGTAELAEAQAKAYGIPFFKVKRDLGDLLDHIEMRGMFPGLQGSRYCTSDHKTSQIKKLVTSAHKAFKNKTGKKTIKVLNCLGFRSEESPSRKKRTPLTIKEGGYTTQKRIVAEWLPIQNWSEEKVWETIKASGVPYHFAYDLGMPRLSCVFCIFASRDALMIAGKANPELLAEYVRVEKKIGHTFRQDLSIESIKIALDNGEQPKEGKAPTWEM